MARAIKRTERVKGGNVNLYPSTWEQLRRRAFTEDFRNFWRKLVGKDPARTP